MKTIDYSGQFSGTAVVRSTMAPGAVTALVIGLLVLCFAVGSGDEPGTAPARAETVTAQPIPAPVPVAPWWGPLVPWVFGLLMVSVIALVVLVVAKLNHSARLAAAELGYGRAALDVPTRPITSGRVPLALGPGSDDPEWELVDGKVLDLEPRRR